MERIRFFKRQVKVCVYILETKFTMFVLCLFGGGGLGIKVGHFLVHFKKNRRYIYIYIYIYIYSFSSM
jgi:hypothetical protein